METQGIPLKYIPVPTFSSEQMAREAEQMALAAEWEAVRQWARDHFLCEYDDIDDDWYKLDCWAGARYECGFIRIEAEYEAARSRRETTAKTSNN